MSKINENLPKTMDDNLPTNSNEPRPSLSPNEELNELSASFIDDCSQQGSNADPQMEKLVAQCLRELKSIRRFDATNKEAIMSFIMPKVMAQLQSPNALAEKLQTMRTELESCKLNMYEMNKDLADIFLDLHYIYKKLEVNDKRNVLLSKQDREKLRKCAQEAETLQERNKHFLSNDPRELSAMFKAPEEQPE
ncbi:uncharacterized protein LOC111074225 isoform X2 [Drosophila obscura]|nr:uncharacterized protein LOC111074225 isoform X2 [Drosophila obscura]